MKQLKYWCDDVLGKLTMYHVVVQGLVVLCGVAAALMVSGYLDDSPTGFVAGIAILVAGSYGSNRLFGWLFGVKPHGESAVITGLILALVFSPPVSVIAGVKLLLVACIAMASKYILVIHGKHVFNPAAIAVVLASVTGLAYASWWVATPALLPFAAIVAIVVLYKTQKFTMGVVFLTTAASLIILQTAIGGSLSAQAVIAAITSWPLVFFAGVMLSEPQTLPPRRTQQYMVAVIVAVLMVLPVHIGPVIMTPALALVIGNTVAFYVGLRRGVSLRLIDKKQIGPDAYELTFTTKPLAFTPGQYIELSLPHAHADFRGVRRIFTLIGRPETDLVSIATRVPAERPSSFKRALLALKQRQVVHATRVAGDFVLPKDTSVPVVFIAGGIGITPFISFLMAAEKRDITLLYAVSSVRDILFADILSRYTCTVVIVTSDEAPLPYTEWQRETGRLTPEVVQKYILPSHSPAVYISGPPHMVDQTRSNVASLGVKTVHTDYFSGY